MTWPGVISCRRRHLRTSPGDQLLTRKGRGDSLALGAYRAAFGSGDTAGRDPRVPVMTFE